MQCGPCRVQRAVSRRGLNDGVDSFPTPRSTRSQLLAAIGGEIRTARLALGWSQRRLESVSGVDQTTISRLERGKLPHLQLLTLVHVIRALDLHLVGRQPEQAPTEMPSPERDWLLATW